MNSYVPSPTALATPDVSTVSVKVADFNQPRIGIYVYNPSTTVTIWVAPTGTTAVAGGAGCIAIEPRQGRNFGPPDGPAWTNGLNAIADTVGANKLTILEYH